MAITVTCPCGKRLKAQDSMVGRRARCPGCGKPILVAAPGEQGAAEPPPLPKPPPVESYALADAPTPTPLASTFYPAEPEPTAEPARRRTKRSPSKSGKTRPRSSHQTTQGEFPWHWLLVLALIPLGFSLLQREQKENIGERIKQTLEKYSPEEQARITSGLERLDKSETASAEDIFDLFPEHRLAGAHLPRKTWMHWLYAAGAAALFFVFLLLISPNRGINPLSLLGIGLFTATIGILFLIVVQYIAAWTEGRWIVGRSIVVIVFYIAKFIGFSYQSALNPDSNFFLSVLGFTLGVGFCEELCKALPLLWHFRRHGTMSWRGAFLWGLASGAAFGVAEGIMYAGNYYNGIATASVYLVRFISCVALHALWSGSVGITLYRCQTLIQQEMAWYDFFPPLFRILGVAMILHGLYDTMLKKDMNALALVVAVVSFGWLVWQVMSMSHEEEASSALSPT